MRDMTLPVSPAYREAVKAALSQQIPIAIFCLLLLDGGHMARFCAIAMIGFWAAVAIFLVRRPLAPRASDLTAIKWGFVPLFVAVVVTTAIVAMGVTD